MIHQTLLYLEGRSRPALIGIIFGLLMFVGAIDVVTGYELSLSIFYLVPVGLASWFGNRKVGGWFCLLGALTWLVADLAAGHPYSHPLIPLWNLLARFGFFVTVNYAFTKLRSHMHQEAQLARRDFVTGLSNLHSFHELADLKLKQNSAWNRPLTLAYVDVEGLKWINDRFGPEAGDQVLCAIAQTIAKSVSNRELVARVAGTAFAVLFPNQEAESARMLLSRIQKSLGVEVSRKYGQPLKFYISAVAFKKAPRNVGELMHEAERLNCRVKDDRLDGLKIEVVDSIHPLL